MKQLGSDESKDRGGAAAKPRKAPYRKPVLETYGSVAELTRGGLGSKFDGPMSTRMGLSDVRAKQDIVRIGTHALGIGVYAYRFRQPFAVRLGHGMHFGVMAHEVAALLPAAVSLDEEGYWRVDYALLARSGH